MKVRFHPKTAVVFDKKIEVDAGKDVNDGEIREVPKIHARVSISLGLDKITMQAFRVYSTNTKHSILKLTGL
jgi:hypothetical protein